MVNLIAKFGQTYGFAASDHVEEIRKYLGKYPDVVLMNSGRLPEKILKKYASEKGFPVKNDLKGRKKLPYEPLQIDLLGSEEIKRRSGDTLKRSLIRHDSAKLARGIMKTL